jgi:hypothetical protein
MHNEFTAITERDDDWFFAASRKCPAQMGRGGRKSSVCSV